MRYEVADLVLHAQDVGGNRLPAPSDATFVLIEPADGSTSSVMALDGVHHQLPVTKSGSQLKVAPFTIISTAAGLTAMLESDCLMLAGLEASQALTNRAGCCTLCDSRMSSSGKFTCLEVLLVLDELYSMYCFCEELPL